MRIADPRIRRVARAIGYNDRLCDGREDRAWSRETAIKVAVRVLDALDTDVIDQWTDTVPSCGGEIRGWINPPHHTDMRVRVTVSHVGPAPGPIDGLTDDEADRFADALREEL